MREPGEIAAALPRPGRTLKALLAIIAAFAVAGAVVVNWAPGGQTGGDLFRALAFEPARALERPWALVTSGVLTSPDGISHALWSLLGLYFLTPDLEKRWGGARLVRFFALSVIAGNLAVLAGSYVLPPKPVFHPSLAFGPMAAITAAVIAWSKEHAGRQIRFMFFLPMSGKTLYWLTIGLALLSLLFLQGSAEGALAPLGGIAAGLLLAGTPSPLRALWLRLRLGRLRRRGGITVEDLLANDHRPRAPAPPRRGGKAPPLRIVQGGLEDELKSRKPPKDKRYLN
jgi:membrane associated rhomboid family serine protease